MRKRAGHFREADAPGSVPSPLIGQQDIFDASNRALALQSSVPGRLIRDIALGITALDMTQLEFQWLRRTASWGFHRAIAASPGVVSGVQLQAAANQICVIESIILGPGAAGQSYFVGEAPVLATGGAFIATLSHPRDSRMGTAARPGTALWSNYPAVLTLPTNPMRFFVAAGQSSLHIPLNYVIAAGGIFSVTTQAVNQDAEIGIIFRERAALGSELL